MKPDRKWLLAVTVLLAAASFTLSRPAAGTHEGSAALVMAKLFGRT